LGKKSQKNKIGGASIPYLIGDKSITTRLSGDRVLDNATRLYLAALREERAKHVIGDCNVNVAHI
jgi:hypothetical protein